MRCCYSYLSGRVFICADSRASSATSRPVSLLRVLVVVNGGLLIGTDALAAPCLVVVFCTYDCVCGTLFRFPWQPLLPAGQCSYSQCQRGSVTHR